MFAEYLTTRLASNLDSSEREDLVKDWEDAMIRDLDALRRHEKNTSFGEGETFEDLQLEFNTWVCIYYYNDFCFSALLV